jgi:hypothetical protein
MNVNHGSGRHGHKASTLELPKRPTKISLAGIAALLFLLASGSSAFAQTTLTPATLSFGNQPVGVASIAKSATLRNTQTVPLTIFSIAISGAFAADYSWGGTCPISPNTLAAGKSCSIPVTFTPSALGSRTATLTITHSAITSPQSVALMGNGIAPVSVSPASVAFSSLFVGTTSPEKTVTLVNHLTTNLTVSSIAATGDFAIVINTCGSGVTAGQKCTIGLTFTPTALGLRQGTLTIAYVASGSPTFVPLSGTGTDTGLTSISVTPANPSIGISGTQQFTATGNLRGGTTQNLTSFVAWSSSKTNVATMTSTGLATGVTLGTSTISATLGSVTGSTILTVSGAPVLVSIAVTPANDSISAGSTLECIATGTYSDGSKQDLTNTAIWNSSAANVATILQTGLLTAVGLGQTTIEATLGAINGSTLLTVTPGFVFTGSPSTPLYSQTATQLNNGMVLIAGGANVNSMVTGAELYNPSAGTFSPTGSLNTPRIFDTATLLNNGTVLIVGGQNNSSSNLASAELYDPAKGTFAFTGSLNIGREYHAATLLSNGKVLITGGTGEIDYPASAELYDPTTGIFTLTGSLNTPRIVHTATALNNGLVLIAGGRTFPTGDSTNSAELYDPSTGIFTPTGNLNAARNQQTATLLNNGLVLIAGGIYENNVIASAELYDPIVGIFNPTASLNTARALCPATLLNNGMVLIAGGTSINGDTLASAELYDPTSEQFTYTGSMNEPRDFQSATLLNNGTVLIAGGDGFTASAELYEPAPLTPPNLVSIAVTPATSSLSPGATQQFIATGTFSDSSTQQLASVTWISSNASVAQINNDATNHGVALAVASGRVTITAAAGTISGSATLTVTHP